MSGSVRPGTAWSAARPDRSIDLDVLARPVVEVARALLGCRLVSTIDGATVVGVIVETEAYGGIDDPASHAATLRGPTERNRAMYGPPGRLYVYRSYGVHWCANVVTGAPGRGSAVLLRGLDVVDGHEHAARRRAGRSPLAAGPGRLCEALGITGAHYDHDLSTDPIRLLAGWSVPDDRIGTSVRVGISVAADRPHRFYVRGSKGVSRPDGWGSGAPSVSDPGERA